MEKQTRIGIGATALFTLAIIGIPFFGWWISGPIMAACAIAAIWGFWPLLPSIAIAGWSGWFFLGNLSLPRVAAKYYGWTRKSDMAEFAERSSRSPDEILNWYGYWMARHGVRIFGKRPPSPTLELVPKDDIGRRFYFNDGAVSLYESYPTRPAFVDLTVKGIDLIKNRKALLGRELGQ
jgi:hypothetical protein